MRNIKTDFQWFMGLISALCLTIVAISLISPYVYATGLAPIPEADLFGELARLILNWGSMGTIAKGSVIVVILTQVIKQLSDFKYKNLVVTFFSVAYAIFQYIGSGSSISSSIITVLFTSGGALLLYNAGKPFLKTLKFLDFLDLGKRK